MPSLAQADEGSFFTMNLVWSIVNFIILVAGFVYLYKKFHGEKFFKTRKDTIEKLIDEAMDLKEKATTRHDEAAKQLTEFDTTRKEIMDDMNARAEKEKQEIAEEGNEMVQRIKKEGERIADAEVQKAKELISEHLQTQLYELSKEYIEKSMDVDSQKHVTDNFIRKIK
jgi:F0F1-type ATP synthase membrane subunit b/b'